MYYIFNVEATGLSSVTLQIDGKLFASNNITHWQSVIKNFNAVLYITSSSFFNIKGSGLFDGQGYDWWWQVILTGTDQRPHLVHIVSSTDVSIEGVTFQNSPQFHLNLQYLKRVVVRDLTINVDVTAQHALLEKHGLIADGIPTYPLNTDGIDPAAEDVLIERVNITSYDDAVAVKPCRADGGVCSCAQNIVVRDVNVFWAVGMTIGSVPPHDPPNCVKNVTFERITFKNPFKAVYIKSNPGTVGSGVIQDITYRDMHVDGSLWYPLWIGPQQQEQPGHGANTGCSFFFPLNTTCPTQPRVSISGVTLQNVTFVNSLLLPGVILCDPLTPCTNFQFTDVTNSGLFLVQKSYYCQNVQGSHSGTTEPAPCF